MNAKALARILSRGTFILVIFLLAGIAYTYGAQSNDSTYGTFNTGGLELKIDSKAFYNGNKMPDLSWYLKDLIAWCDKFFNFDDIKPGDTGRTIISLHIKKSSAWTCLDFTNFKDKENGKNEPEAAADPNSTGEMGKEMEFFAWFDDNNNTKFDVGEKPLFGTTSQSAIMTLKDKTYALADSKHGSAWKDGSTHYVGILWCAGDLTVNLATAAVGCNGAAMGNEAQTDSMSLDIALRAVASGDNKNFLCSGNPPRHEENSCKFDDKKDDKGHGKKDDKKGNDKDKKKH